MKSFFLAYLIMKYYFCKIKVYYFLVCTVCEIRDIQIVWILKSGVFSVKSKQTKRIVLLSYKINYEAFSLFFPSKVV